MGIVKTPELYRCAVSWAGVTDLLMFVVDQRNYLNKTAAAERSIGRWWEDRQRLKETSPAELAARIRTPVLLAHAEDDRVVFVRHARVMRDALKDAGAQDVQYLDLRSITGSPGKPFGILRCDGAFSRNTPGPLSPVYNCHASSKALLAFHPAVKHPSYSFRWYLARRDRKNRASA
jgi:hypothetical protein